MHIKTIRTYKRIKGKKVFLRGSLNVPVKNGRIKDAYRLERQLPTLRFLRQNGAKTILAGHLGRPTAGVYDPKESMLPVVKYLEKQLGRGIRFVPGEIDLRAATAVAEMQPGDILVLDNLRFNAGEKKNSKLFAKKLASLADIYVSDAFDNAHRADASMDAIKYYLPAYAGLLMEQELLNLSALFKPKQPLVVILGGAKIETKLPLVKQFQDKAERIIIGGALATSFLKARGYEVGRSLIDEDSLRFANSYKKDNLLLPVDVIVAKDEKGARAYVKKLKEITTDDYIFDIGPETLKLYRRTIGKAASLIWNGPMGFFEVKAFRAGTMGVCEAVARRAKGPSFGVVGGGETVEALMLSKYFKNVDWVSTGGGAMLAFLGRQELPGIDMIAKS